MMSQGGGWAGGVGEMGVCCLCWQQHILGQGGGQEFLIVKIRMGVGIIGQGGGHCFEVVSAGECVL
jgi:hypothetical protein